MKHLFFCLALLAGTSPAFADEPKPGMISVTATGSANIAPDMAVMSLTVSREAKTAREALDTNSKAMADVLAAMKDAGVAERDLQTSNFNIQPKYFYPKRKTTGEQNAPKIVGYFVNNSLTVRIRKLSDVGALLDKSVSLGVNSGGNIQFTNDNPDTALKEARKSAMAKAIAKAKTLTEAAGVSLGRITNISENSRGRPQPKAFARSARIQEADAVPIAAGENAYTVNVNVQWELKQ